MRRMLIHMPIEMLSDIRELSGSLTLSSSAFVRLAVAQAVEALRHQRVLAAHRGNLTQRDIQNETN